MGTDQKVVPHSDAYRAAALEHHERQTQLLEKILETINDFAAVLLRAKFPYGKPTDRFDRWPHQ